MIYDDIFDGLWKHMFRETQIVGWTSDLFRMVKPLAPRAPHFCHLLSALILNHVMPYITYIYLTRCLIVWYCLIWLSQIGFGKTSFSLYAKPRDPHPDQGASNVWKELSPSIASPSAKGISHLCLEEVENRILFMTTWCTKNIKKMAIDIHRES